MRANDTPRSAKPRALCHERLRDRGRMLCWGADRTRNADRHRYRPGLGEYGRYCMQGPIRSGVHPEGPGARDDRKEARYGEMLTAAVRCCADGGLTGGIT